MAAIANRSRPIVGADALPAMNGRQLKNDCCSLTRGEWRDSILIDNHQRVMSRAKA
jgi:hypothetical protein